MNSSISHTGNSKRGRPRVGSTGIHVAMPPAELVELDGWIARQTEHVSRPEALRALAKLGIAAERQTRAKAKTDAADERAASAVEATAEYAAAQRAQDVKTARLRQARLEKVERDRVAAATAPPAAAMTVKARKKLAAEKPLTPDRANQQTAGAARAKDLAVGAVRKELAKVDASLDEKIARTKKLVKRPVDLERQAPTDRSKKQ